MSCVLSSHCSVKHEVTEAERADNAVSSEKLKCLTTRQEYLPHGRSNPGFSPEEKILQTESKLILG